MVGHGGSSAGSYLTDPTSPIPSHYASIVATSTLRVITMHLCEEETTTCNDLRPWDRTPNSLMVLTLEVLVATIDAQWEGMGDVGSARYEPALLPPCPTIRVLSYSN